MKLHSLEIPDASDKLAAWLEGHLTGPHLAELIAELNAVHGPPEVASTLDDHLQDESWLNEGLGRLPRTTIARLLQEPTLLLELQERILVEGGDYWQRLLERADAREFQAADRHREAIVRQATGKPEAIDADQGMASSRSQPDRPDKTSVTGNAEARVRNRQHSQVTMRIPWYRQPLWVSVLTAAATVLLLLGGQTMLSGPTPSTQPVAWGWNGPDAMPGDVSAKDYFEVLARGGEAWFNQRPEDATSLAQRILEMRQGCNRLILGEHPPLTPDDKQWLVDKCRAWASKFDAQLAALEAGTDPITVRSEMDVIVGKLVTALRERAAS